MYLLHTGALFQPELSLAVRTAHIAVGLDVLYPHILPLAKIRGRAVDIGKTAVLVHPLGDVSGQGSPYEQSRQQQDDHHQDSVADKNIDEIQALIKQKMQEDEISGYYRNDLPDDERGYSLADCENQSKIVFLP